MNFFISYLCLIIVYQLSGHNIAAEVCSMKILTLDVRQNKEITLIQLSQMTGISKTTLNNIEREKVSPTLKELEAIAKALNVTINDLFESEYK